MADAIKYVWEGSERNTVQSTLNPYQFGLYNPYALAVRTDLRQYRRPILGVCVYHEIRKPLTLNSSSPWKLELGKNYKIMYF